MNNQIDPNIVIDRLGGTSATARFCKIQPGSVSEWRVNGIPKARLMYLELARPDVFEPAEENEEGCALTKP